jgi:large subunit ribosomal protein L25
MQASLVATKRETRGKNEARRLRVSGHIPAVVYGGTAKESVSVSVDPKKLLQILYSDSGVNTLIDLELAGGDSSQVLVKDFQLDPVSTELLHVDFYRLAMDKAITVLVPVTLIGEAIGVKQEGGLLDFVNREIQIECMPTEIPETVKVDVGELSIGDGVRVRDVVEGVVWKPISELDTLLVHVTAPKVEEEEAEEEEASAEGAAVSEAGGESEGEKKSDEGAASDRDK